MTNRNNIKTILIPIYLLILLLGQSCISVQKMRYTKGIHIDISSYGKADKKVPSHLHANRAKKNQIKTQVTSIKAPFIETTILIEKPIIGFAKSNELTLPHVINDKNETFHQNISKKLKPEIIKIGLHKTTQNPISTTQKTAIKRQRNSNIRRSVNLPTRRVLANAYVVG